MITQHTQFQCHLLLLSGSFQQYQIQSVDSLRAQKQNQHLNHNIKFTQIQIQLTNVKFNQSTMCGIDTLSHQLPCNILQYHAISCNAIGAGGDKKAGFNMVTSCKTVRNLLVPRKVYILSRNKNVWSKSLSYKCLRS